MRKATEIIDHLRTFGQRPRQQDAGRRKRGRRPSAASLLREQMRLRDIDSTLTSIRSGPEVAGNGIQLEQVVMNLLTNARDAVSSSSLKDRPHSDECR